MRRFPDVGCLVALQYVHRFCDTTTGNPHTLKHRTLRSECAPLEPGCLHVRTSDLEPGCSVPLYRTSRICGLKLQIIFAISPRANSPPGAKPAKRQIIFAISPLFAPGELSDAAISTFSAFFPGEIAEAAAADNSPPGEKSAKTPVYIRHLHTFLPTEGRPFARCDWGESANGRSRI